MANITQDYFFINSDYWCSWFLYMDYGISKFCHSNHFNMFYFQGCWLTKVFISYNIKTYDTCIFWRTTIRWHLFIYYLCSFYYIWIEVSSLRSFNFLISIQKTLTKIKFHGIKCGRVEMFLWCEWNDSKKKEERQYKPEKA